MSEHSVPSAGEANPIDPRAAVRDLIAVALDTPVEAVGPHARLIDLGLDSLEALELRNRLIDAFGTAPEPSVLLGGTTVAELGDLVARGSGSAAGRPDLSRAAGGGPGEPLSWLQRALWFEYERCPDSSAYHIGGAIRIRGVTPGAVRGALDGLFARHPELLCSYGTGPAGPVRRRWGGPIPVAAADATAWDEVALAARLNEEWNRPFVLTAQPPTRARVYRRGADESVILLVVHHITADYRSLELLIAEWAALCRAALGGVSPPPPPRADLLREYADWHERLLAGHDGERLRRYWREQLDGDSAPPAWPARFGDNPAPPPRTAGQSHYRLAPDLTASVLALARAAGATPFVVFLTAFQFVLSRYTHQPDIRVATPVAVRPTRAFDQAVGYLSNTVVLRANLDENLTVETALERGRVAVLAALDHAAYPLALAADDRRGGVQAQATFVSYGFGGETAGLAALALQLPGERFRWGDWGVESVPIKRAHCQTDLTLALGECDGGAALAVEYDASVFDPVAIDRFAGHYDTALRGMVANPAGRIADLSLLTTHEAARFNHWNATATTYPDSHVLHQLVAATIARRPDETALIHDGRAVGYRDLSAQAAAVARRLSELGVGRGDRVAVAVPACAEMVAGILGVLTAGAAYLPVAVEDDGERARVILADARPAALLVGPDGRGQRLAGGCPVVTLPVPTRPSGRDSPGAAVSPDDPAYVIYTSGSTGRPKGVVVSHRAICNRLLWMRDRYPLGPADRILQKTPLTFDVSLWELFLPLIAGVPMIVGRASGYRDPAYLARLIDEQRVTVVHFVPSVLRAFLDEPGATRADALRRVFASGEVLPGAVRDLLFRRLPRAELHNLYGPTEAAVDVTAWACSPRDVGDHVPIGTPIANVRAHVLDPAGRRVPVGVAGELYLAGVGLAFGYFGAPEQTAERFLTLSVDGGPAERVYRTGDRARFRPDGVLEFLGRLDDQVKIRGVRVEPAEVTAVLRRHPGVLDCAVAAHRAEGTVLIAYVVPGEPAPTAAELRDFVRARLPDAFVPSRVCFLAALPLTDSGKLNRAALSSSGADEPDESDDPPVTPAEESLARAWREVLGVARVGAGSDFFELGGDSLRAIQLRAALLRAGLDLSVPDLFANPGLRAQAARVRTVDARSFAPRAPFALLPAATADALRDRYEDAFPLARLQEGLLFHSRSGGAYEVYVLGLTLRGRYDDAAFRTALVGLIRRHPMLRAGYDLTDITRPIQCIHRAAPVPLAVEDLTANDPAEQDRVIAAWSEAERTRPFDWAVPPLLRVRVHLRAADLFQVTVSHPLFDGWSLITLLTELFADYGAALRGSPPCAVAPALSYADFVAAEQEAAASPEARAFWRARLAAVGPARRGPARGGARARRQVPIPDAVARGLRAAARVARVPLKSLLLATHLRVRGELTARGVASTGLITNGRFEEVDGDRAVGLFLNTVLLTVALGAETWREAARAALRAERELWPHRRYPFADLLELADGTPFDTVFNFVHFYNAAARPDGAPEVVGWQNPADFTFFPFAVYFVDDPLSGALLLYLDHDTHAYSGEDIDRTAEYYLRALAAAGDPDARADRTRLLSDEDLDAQRRWNATARRFDHPEVPVHRLIEDVAANQPAAPAVRFGGDVFSYRAVDAAADLLAANLRARGVRAEEPVGLCVARGPAQVVAMLGVLKAGGAFVPLAADWPAGRLGEVVRDCDLRVIVADGLFPAAGPEVAVVPVPIALDAGPDASPESQPEAVGLDQLAYVIYTSGSTGTPKGVEVTHAGLRNNLLAVAEVVGVTPGDTWLALTPLSFDIAILELLLPLVAGARVTMAGAEEPRDAGRLAALLAEEEWTVAQATPSVWRLAVAGGWGGTRAGRVLCGGEVLTRGLADELLSRAGAVWNLYGPTEATIWAAAARVAAGPDDPPVGRPLANTALYVVGESLGPLPTGAAGELVIGGAGVARGYRNRPESTAARFVPDPFAGAPGARAFRTGDRVRFRPDGQIEFLGRTDGQVKVRGHRIELEGIEAQLARHPGVRAAAVGIRTAGDDDRRLVAYVVPTPGGPPTAGALAAFLTNALPAYMIPSEFYQLTALPLSTNWKVDRAALATAAGAPLPDDGWDEPRTETERLVAAVWAAVLGRAAVGRGDSFFLLGGHSLLALRVCGQLEEALGRPVPAAVLFEYPTVAALGKFLDAGPAPPVAAAARAQFRRARADQNRPAADRRRGAWAARQADGPRDEGGDESNRR